MHGFLRNNSWETRVAAGQALEAIAKNVPQWMPQGTPKSGKDMYIPRLTALKPMTRENRKTALRKKLQQVSLPTPFYSVLVSVSGFMALSTVFHSINSLTLFFRSYLCPTGPFNTISL